jgi:hypothetical protein
MQIVPRPIKGRAPCSTLCGQCLLQLRPVQAETWGSGQDKGERCWALKDLSVGVNLALRIRGFCHSSAKPNCIQDSRLKVHNYVYSKYIYMICTYHTLNPVNYTKNHYKDTCTYTVCTYTDAYTCTYTVCAYIHQILFTCTITQGMIRYIYQLKVYGTSRANTYNAYRLVYMMHDVHV